MYQNIQNICINELFSQNLTQKNHRQQGHRALVFTRTEVSFCRQEETSVHGRVAQKEAVLRKRYLVSRKEV